MKRKWALFMLALAQSSPAASGPDLTANRFLDDSPSMMDFGAYRLQQKLKEDGFQETFVSYDWDRNRVIIGRTYIVDGTPTDAKEKRKEWLNAIRRAAIINTRTGEPFMKDGLSSFVHHFSHAGFGRTINNVSEQDALRALDKLFLIRGETYDLQNDGRRVFACEGQLLGTTISIEE